MTGETSDFTREQAVEVIATYASKALRWCEYSHGQGLAGFPMGSAPPDQIDIVIRIPGSFGSAENFFEALRVLGGHTQPAPTEKYRHVKSGRLYEKLGEVMNATAGHPGEVLVRYRAVNSSDIEFVRRVEEFAERFTEVKE